MPNDYDMAIIGGGIHGATLADAAASQGLRVALYEANDIGSGASSGTPGLLSGDLRQLELLALENVRHNLQEQARAHQRAPHLVRPRIFALLDNPRVRSPQRVKAGCFVYRRLQNLRVSHDDYHCPRAYLNQPDTGIHTYVDCLIDDSRYTLSQAMAARNHGADIFPRHRLTAARRIDRHWQLQLHDQQGETHQIRSHILINASGAQINDVLKAVIQRPSRCRIKRFGSGTLVVRKPEWPNQCLSLQADNGRLITVTPFHHQTFLIGASLSNQPEPHDGWEQELIELVNRYLDDKLESQHILQRHWGVRPIYDDPSCSDLDKSRQYLLDLDCPEGHSPLLNIFGGNLCCHHLLAEQALRILAPHLDSRLQSGQPVLNQPLPGGDLPGAENPDQARSRHLSRLQKLYPRLKVSLLQRLTTTYGSLCEQILGDSQTEADLGTDFGQGLFEREVNYLQQREWAATAEDILWRRTHLGLVMSQLQQQRLREWL